MLTGDSAISRHRCPNILSSSEKSLTSKPASQLAGQAFRYKVGHSHGDEARLRVGETLLDAPGLLCYLRIDLPGAFLQRGDIALELLALLRREAGQLQLHHLGGPLELLEDAVLQLCEDGPHVALLFGGSLSQRLLQACLSLAHTYLKQLHQRAAIPVPQFGQPLAHPFRDTALLRLSQHIFELALTHAGEAALAQVAARCNHLFMQALVIPAQHQQARVRNHHGCIKDVVGHRACRDAVQLALVATRPDLGPQQAQGHGDQAVVEVRQQYHLNNSGRAKATIWWNAWCSERREGKTSKSMRMFLLVDIASEFARRGDAVHVVAPQEAAR